MGQQVLTWSVQVLHLRMRYLTRLLLTASFVKWCYSAFRANLKDQRLMARTKFQAIDPKHILSDRTLFDDDHFKFCLNTHRLLWHTILVPLMTELLDIRPYCFKLTISSCSALASDESVLPRFIFALMNCASAIAMNPTKLLSWWQLYNVYTIISR